MGMIDLTPWRAALTSSLVPPAVSCTSHAGKDKGARNDLQRLGRKDMFELCLAETEQD